MAQAGLSYEIDAPEEITIGSWFNVTVNLSADEAINFSVYSYVYRGLDVISQGWTANRQEISLGAGETRQVVLEDLIKHGTEEGIYDLRVRFRTGEQVLNETFSVKVMAESKFIEESYLYFALVVVSVIGLGLVFVSRR
jgi:hypothetical protein